MLDDAVLIETHDPQFLALAERMERAFVWTLAKGGFNLAYAWGDKARVTLYQERKSIHGWAAWDDLSRDEQTARRTEPCVECGCVEWYEEDDRLKWAADEACRVCGGEGRRRATGREIRALDYAVRKHREQERRDRSGDDCWVEYVMRSQDVLEEWGCWNAPYETDGWRLDRTKRPKELPTVERTMPVKVYRGNQIVAVVEKPVRLTVHGAGRCRAAWRPVRAALVARSHELAVAVQRGGGDAVADEVLRRLRIDVTVCLEKIHNFGECLAERDRVERLLGTDGFDAVAGVFS